MVQYKQHPSEHLGSQFPSVFYECKDALLYYSLWLGGNSLLSELHFAQGNQGLSNLVSLFSVFQVSLKCQI